MKAYKTIYLLFISLCLTGCAHTYIADMGKDSPDAKYNIHIICHGKSARAYSDYTIKKAFVIIVDNNKSSASRLFEKWVILEAANLSWQYTWIDSSSVKIDFYEKKESNEINNSKGFLIIKKDGNTNEFKISEYANNLKLKDKVYFF